MDDPLESAKAKLNWANEHLRSLYGDMGEFIKGKPYATRINLDANAGWYTLTMQCSKPFPADWPLRVGDGIQNLRSTLDHIAWAFALNTSGGEEPSAPQEVSFPITSNPDWFASRPVKDWVSSDQWTFMEEQQPYKRGDYAIDWLWKLGELSNRDKHRVLHTAFARAEENVNLRFRWDERQLGRLIKQELFPFTETLLVDGTQFARVRFERTDPNAKVEMEGETTLVIAFGDTSVRARFPDIGRMGCEIDGIVEGAASLFT